MGAFIGEIAGLVTSGFYSASSTCFSIAGRKISAINMNRARLLIALGFLLLAHLLLRTPLPLDLPLERMGWIALSGAVGLTLGDLCLYEGYARIGARLTMLMMSLAPVLSALLAAIFLAERLSPGQVAGILITVGGIAWVIADRRSGSSPAGGDRQKYLTGLLFGLGAAAGQTFGLVTAKRGLGSDLPAISATLIRMSAAALTLWTYTLLRGQMGDTLRQLRSSPYSTSFIFLGALVGPTLGVTFSMIALQNTAVGIASTLMALPPVLLLPVGYFFFKERFGWQAIAGTFVAVGGVALLFLV
jgi:drug/metabolite transporter (DMT)-like permease